MKPDGPEAVVRGVDPWGLRRVERLLQSLEGVHSIKIVPSGTGGIDEVHVLSASDLGAKQIVRNIESALLAEFGLQVDHRKISVARVATSDIEAARLQQTEQEAEPAATHGEQRLILDSFQIERKAGTRAVARVTLAAGEAKFTGEADGPDLARARLEITAVAVLEALQQALEDRVGLSLEGISKVEAVGRSMVIAVVNAVIGRKSTSLIGAAKVSDSQEEAAIEACLHATNRWIGGI